MTGKQKLKTLKAKAGATECSGLRSRPHHAAPANDAQGVQVAATNHRTNLSLWFWARRRQILGGFGGGD